MNPHQRVQAYLDQFNLGIDIIALDENTATSQLAAAALGVRVGQIAKSLLFRVANDYVLVIAAGDVKIKQGKLKAIAGGKAKLASPREVEELTGYPVGGVCPFALANPIKILLDKSLGDYDLVYAAAGSAHSAVPISLEQLEMITGGTVVNLTG